MWNHYLQQLPKAIQKKINRLRQWQDQQRGLLGKLLLRKALTNFGFSADCLESIAYDQNGRPFFHTGIDFNISHSGEYVVCTLTDSGKVGIDIEEIKPVNLMQFRSYLTDQEFEKIHAASDGFKMFYTVWTQKESVLKANGRGLSIPLADVYLNENGAQLHGKKWFLKMLEIDQAYRCSLSTDIIHPQTEIIEIRFHRIGSDSFPFNQHTYLCDA